MRQNITPEYYKGFSKKDKEIICKLLKNNSFVSNVDYWDEVFKLYLPLLSIGELIEIISIFGHIHISTTRESATTFYKIKVESFNLTGYYMFCNPDDHKNIELIDSLWSVIKAVIEDIKLYSHIK